MSLELFELVVNLGLLVTSADFGGSGGALAFGDSLRISTFEFAPSFIMLSFVLPSSVRFLTVRMMNESKSKNIFEIQVERFESDPKSNKNLDWWEVKIPKKNMNLNIWNWIRGKRFKSSIRIFITTPVDVKTITKFPCQL